MTLEQLKEEKIEEFVKTAHTVMPITKEEAEKYAYWWSSSIDQAYELGQEEYKQFILNILDGIDIADKELGNAGGGTKAIRFAIQSKIISLKK